MFFIFYFFNSPPDLRASSANRRKTLPRDQYIAEFYNASTKISGTLHAKYGEILHNFWLWSWISPEGLKISKIGKICVQEWFLPRSAKQVQWTLVHYL